jgi:nicotinate-nucleotide adenylyltransferase
MRKIGLFFGSFNPVHVGHMIIANHVVQNTGLDEVWMVVSPHNPLKQKESLAKDYDRLHMIELAIGDESCLRSSNVEFALPKPSYTIDTLIFLTEKYPDKEFFLLMGADNLLSFDKWKNYEKILELTHIIVYERPGYDNGPFANHPQVSFVPAPKLDISSSFIRNEIKKGKSVKYLVPDAVYEFLQSSMLYK